LLFQPLPSLVNRDPALVGQSSTAAETHNGAHRPTIVHFPRDDTHSFDLQHSFHNRQICRLKKKERITNPNRAADPRTDLHKKTN
jgi:hypothetical protein